MERVATFSQEILDDPSTSWEDKGLILDNLFYTGEVSFSEYLKLKEILDDKKFEWFKEKYNTLKEFI